MPVRQDREMCNTNPKLGMKLAVILLDLIPLLIKWTDQLAHFGGVCGERTCRHWNGFGAYSDYVMSRIQPAPDEGYVCDCSMSSFN